MYYYCARTLSYKAIKLKNCNSIRRLTNLRYLVLRDLFCAYPRSLPLTLLEHVICVFRLVLDLVLVFCGFWLVPDLLAASPFHHIAKTTYFIWSPPRGGLID